ncbi:MAG: hypothetical protein AUH86_05675 [Acidobacteria bacterium 13_1_40CM_4_58_4]|nr:MAG: hypothetical protein AUH86_05675 [Acidobacteria bacterium 13_1_40CM_4_58_4]
MLILNGFAVDEQAAVVVKMQSSGVQGQNRFWCRRGGWRRVVGLNGWRDGMDGWCCENGAGPVGGRCGRIEAGSFAALRMTDGGRRCAVRSGSLWGAG